MARLPILLVAIMAAACSSSPPPSAAPTGEVPDGAEQLIVDLSAAGASVQTGSFDPAPLSGQATLLCVDGEEVRVYVYASELEAAAAASRIDATDPSNVGTAIIEWAGNPRVWHRDRILVLYLGRDEATESLLTATLGPPFARGLGREPGPRGMDC